MQFIFSGEQVDGDEMQRRYDFLKTGLLVSLSWGRGLG